MRKLYRFQPITVPGDDRGGKYSFPRTLSHGAHGMSGPKISWAPLPQAHTTLRDPAALADIRVLTVAGGRYDGGGCGMSHANRYAPLGGNAPRPLQAVGLCLANVENSPFSIHFQADMYSNCHFLYTSLVWSVAA